MNNWVSFFVIGGTSNQTVEILEMEEHNIHYDFLIVKRKKDKIERK